MAGSDLGEFTWPDGARLAISLVLNVEEWSSDRPARFAAPWPPDAVTERDQTTVSDRAYGFRRGIARILDLLDRQGVKMSVVTGGLAAERHPEIVREIHRRGHEIAGHSYDQSRYLVSMPTAEQRKVIRRSADALVAVTGQRPLGWLSPGGRCTEQTAALLQEAGFLYHNDYVDDDLPHRLDLGRGKSILAMPYSLLINDYRFFHDAAYTPDQAFSALAAELEALYAESAREARLMTFGFHPYVTGRPGRAAMLERFIQYARKYPGVCFARRDELARWWLEHGPEV